MELPEILTQPKVNTAAELVRDYYGQELKDGRRRTGSRFDSWAGGGDAPEVVNRVTPDDLIAVSFLGVRIKGQAAIGLLETYAKDVSDLLAEIPTDLDLVDADPTRDLGKGTAPDELWDLVRGKRGGKWGVGQTIASKIMARKRPRLIPIYDSVVGPSMGLKDAIKQWDVWHAALTNGEGLPQRLEQIRTLSGVTEPLSPLRIMDVVLWLDGKRNGVPTDMEPEDAEDR